MALIIKPTKPAVNRRRVLVIDDEVDLTLLLRLNLQKTGRYEVTEQNDPTKALATARACKPDLILLDVMMPGMDGGDVLAQLKDDANLRNVPIVFLTATVLPEEMKSKGGMISGHPAIPKPFQVDKLVTRIDNILAGADKAAGSQK